MVYEVFLKTLTERLEDKLGDSYQLVLHKIPKNNGVKLDGLSLQGTDLAMAPTVYPRSYYEQYDAGMPLDEICDDILSLFLSTPVSSYLSPEELEEFSLVRSKVMFKLIHASSNRELLADMPHLPFLDLAIVFYLLLDRNEYGQITLPITKEHLKRWNLSLDHLWGYAARNTPREFPAEICSLNDLALKLAKKHLGDAYDEDELKDFLESQIVSPLHILSNQTGLCGAGCLLYPEILKNFADKLDSDLIILPSSIHEVLITPDTTEVSYEELSHMVTTINQREVLPEEQLSNQVYRYTRHDDRLFIASHAEDAVGITAETITR